MDSLTKVCRKCGEGRPRDEYSKRSVSPDGLHLYCRRCLKLVNAEAYLVRKGRLVRLPKPPKTEKTCTRCQKVLPIEAFYVKRGKQGGRDSICPPCWIEYSRERKAADPDSGAKAARRSLAWRAAHPEAAAEVSRRYWLKNIELRRAVNKQWQVDNPEQAKAHRSKRRALKKASRAFPFSPEQLAQRMAYFGNACWMCRGDFDEIDHVKPLSKGGLHVLSNLRPSCAHCNNAKHARWYGPHNLDRFVKS